jgi:hypothetical protein
MKGPVEAFTDSQAFLDTIHLYRHRDRRNVSCNLMDRFAVHEEVHFEAYHNLQ